ncbi:MAG: class I SAM-dependent methyltransferase [Nitrospirota bacterium]
MKLNLFERFITNNPIRAFLQRHAEGPMLKKMGSRKEYPLCLEIGCGRGIGAGVIVEKFGAEKVIATDIDPEQINRAMKNLRLEYRDKIEFKVADAMEIDEPADKFDAVFSFGVIHHMEDWRRAIREVSRVLRRGGEFFFEEPLHNFTRHFTKGSLLGVVATHPKGGLFSFEKFRDELKNNNVDIINVKRIGNSAIFGVGRKR